MAKSKYGEYGCSRGGCHPLYDAWRNMKRRCYLKTTKFYKNYGGRGISVCEEWRNDYLAFLNWSLNNGWRKGLQLDRIDNSGDYSPDNCRWVTQQENLLNTRHNHNVTYKGKTQPAKLWAKELGICYTTFLKRLYNWGVEDAITRPIVESQRRVRT